jgi:ATP-dependent protease HslVU (ClpYQ) peptidase subunit
MTTLVYRDGILASETRITYGSVTMPGKCKKIHRLPGGALYGFVGSLEVGEIMRRCLLSDNPEERPDLKGEAYEGLVITETGKVLFFENRAWIRLDLPYVAMGSGNSFAYGALAMGASAKQAVQAAMGLDAGSGGKVMTLELKGWKGQRSYADCYDEEVS